MKLNNKYTNLYQAGFTLVEIMVGMVVGLLVTLVIVQVMSVFEGQRRASTGTADAQTNGQIALYNIGRQLQLAGYPLMPTSSVPIGNPNVIDSPLECTTLTFGATGITSINPVALTDGVVSDAITIRYGESASGGVPTKISGAAGAPNPGDVPVDSNFGCAVGDISFVANGPNCSMSSVTAISAVAVTPKTVTLENTTNAVAGADISCLGNWHTITYAANPGTGNLEMQDIASTPVDPAVPVPPFAATVDGIVNLQAQYGISASANSNVITSWVDAAAPWDAPTVAMRNRIKAIRIAIVACNAKLEPAAVTTDCSSTTAAVPTGLCAWAGTVASPAPTVDLSGDANWARYRYRVYETIIPLRNMIWSKDTL